MLQGDLSADGAGDAHRTGVGVLEIDDTVRDERSRMRSGYVMPRGESVDAVPAALRRLVEVLAGAAPLGAVDESFAATFRTHMGVFSTRATAADWKRWVLFMRETGRIDDLRLDLLDLRLDGECWSGTACWTGQDRCSATREARRSDPLRVCWRLQDGKIVELWTVPWNYVLVLGRLMNSHAGFLLILVRFRRWCARQGEGLSRRIESA